VSRRKAAAKQEDEGVEVLTLENFPFWVPTNAESIGVAGMKRKGKSALLKRWCAFLMEELPKQLPGWGVVAFDIHDEYSVLGHERDDCQLGPLPQRCVVEEFLGLLEEDPEARVLFRRNLFLSLVTEDSGLDSAEVARQVRSALPHIRRRGKVICIFDEVGYYGHHIEESLRTVVACWGKDDVVPMFGTQGVTECPEPVRKQWTTLVSAKQVKRSDLLFIKGQAGRAVALGIVGLEPKPYVTADLEDPAPELLAALMQ
jgi:hypothetical protein